MTILVRMMGMVSGLLLMVLFGGAYASDEAGMVKVVNGNATIERGDQKIIATPGAKLLVSDRVLTGVASSMGITLHDGTLLSLGPKSSLSLNKFAFDSTTNLGALDASLKRGTLAVVSGKLSKSSPDAVTYRTPTSILGVRGTEFIIEAGAEDN
jgi:hypothetical protein